MPDLIFSFLNLVENWILRIIKIANFLLNSIFHEILRTLKFLNVLNFNVLNISGNIEFRRKVPILMFLRIQFSARLKKENVKSGNFQFSQNVLNLSKSYVLNISWNIDFRQKFPILMFLGIQFSTRLKKENVKSGNFQFFKMFLISQLST